MSVKSKIKKKVKAWVDKARDEKTRKRIKDEVLKRIKQGKATIARLQAEINKPANRAKAAEQVKRAKAALAHLKKEAKVRERQAVAYTKKNPEKALVMAVAAGAAAGALMAMLKKRR